MLLRDQIYGGFSTSAEKRCSLTHDHDADGMLTGTLRISVFGRDIPAVRDGRITASRVSGLTNALLFSTRETVVTDTAQGRYITNGDHIHSPC